MNATMDELLVFFLPPREKFWGDSTGKAALISAIRTFFLFRQLLVQFSVLEVES
jgi:hypothetical protein